VTVNRLDMLFLEGGEGSMMVSGLPLLSVGGVFGVGDLGRVGRVDGVEEACA